MNLIFTRFTQRTTLVSIIAFLLFLSPFIFSTLAFAKYDPDLEWHTQETPHFLFHYHDGLESTVGSFTKHAEKIHKDITKFFNWTPKSKTHVILSDHFDLPNGRASPFPSNVIEMRMTPPSTITSLEDFTNWQYLLFEHEYVHIVHLDKAEDFPLHLRSVLGRHWLLFPNQYLPKWIIEGIATYIETHEDEGAGRGQSSYFRALMRNEVKNGIRSLYQVNQAQLDWPGGTNRYLYGVYFFTFLEKKYGEDSIKEFMQAYSSFPIPYFINTVFTKVYGKGLYALWDEFQIYLHEEFDAEINEPRTLQNNQHQISSTGFQSGFSKVLPNGDVLFIENNHEEIKSLVRYDPTKGSYTTILQSPAIGSSFDIHPDKGILIPMVDWVHSSRLVTDLYHLDLQTLIKTRLTQDQRYIHAIWHPNGKQIIAVKNEASQHSLDLLDNSGQYIKTLWNNDRDVVISSMAISPAGSQIVASIFRPNSGWNLEIFNMNKLEWSKLTNDKDIESHPQFTNDGEKIIFTAEYSRIYNIYELTLKDNTLNQLTDTDAAAHYPTLDESSNTLYYSSLDKNGFNLHAQSISTLQYSVNHLFKSPNNKSNNNLVNSQIDSQISSQVEAAPTNTTNKELPTTNYNALKYLPPPWWEPLPLALINSNQTTLGLVTSNFDPIKRHFYSLVLAYDIKNTLPIWNIQYTYARFLPEFTLGSSRENYYPNETEIRQERSARLSVNLPLNKINNNWNIFSSLKRINSRNLLRSNLDKIKDSENDDLIALGVSWGTTSQSTRAVTQNSGTNISLSYELNQFSQPIKPHSRIIFNASLYSPLVLSSVAELNTTVIAAGNDAGTLFLGGDGIELFNSGLAGKRSYSLPGYDDSFTGTNLQKFVFNLHIPLANPQRSIMSPPFGISRIKLLPFVQTARVDSYRNINQADWHSSVGTELSIQSNFGYGFIPFTLKMGIAKGVSSAGIVTSYFAIFSQFL